MSALNLTMDTFGLGLGSAALRREREETVAVKTGAKAVTCAEFERMTLNQMLYRVLVEEK